MFWIFKKKKETTHTISINSEDKKYIDSIIGENIEIVMRKDNLSLTPEEIAKIWRENMILVSKNIEKLMNFCEWSDHKTMYFIHKIQESICIFYENWIKDKNPEIYDEDEKWCEYDDEVDTSIWVSTDMYEWILKPFSKTWYAIDTFTWDMRKRLTESHRWKILFWKK